MQEIAGQVTQFCLANNADVVELFGHRPEDGTGFHARQARAYADVDAMSKGNMVSQVRPIRPQLVRFRIQVLVSVGRAVHQEHGRSLRQWDSAKLAVLRDPSEHPNRGARQSQSLLDHLGDVLMALGEKTEAVAVWKKSIEAPGDSKREEKRKEEVLKKIKAND